MPTQNVNLPDRQARFIQKRVKSGRYQNASEVVRAALRLLEQKEAEDELRLRTLRRVAAESFEALDRGESATLTPESVEAMFDGIDQRVRGR